MMLCYANSLGTHITMKPASLVWTLNAYIITSAQHVTITRTKPTPAASWFFFLKLLEFLKTTGFDQLDAFRGALQITCKFSLDHFLIQHCRISGVRLDCLDPKWEGNLKKLDQTFDLYTPCGAFRMVDGRRVTCEVPRNQHTHSHESSIPKIPTPNWKGQFEAPVQMFPKVYRVALMEFEILDKDTWMLNYRVERLKLLKGLHEFVSLEDSCLSCFQVLEENKLFSGATCGHAFCEDCWTDIHEAAIQKNDPVCCPCCGKLFNCIMVGM